MDKVLKITALLGVVILLGVATKIIYTGFAGAYNHMPYASPLLAQADPADDGEWTDDGWDTYFQPDSTTIAPPPPAPVQNEPASQTQVTTPPSQTTNSSSVQTQTQTLPPGPTLPQGNSQSSASQIDEPVYVPVKVFPRGATLTTLIVTTVDQDDGKALPAHVLIKSAQGAVLGEGDADVVSGKARVKLLSKDVGSIGSIEALVGRRQAEVAYTHAKVSGEQTIQGPKILLPKIQIELKGQVYDPQSPSAKNIEAIKRETFLDYLVGSLKQLLNINK